MSINCFWRRIIVFLFMPLVLKKKKKRQEKYRERFICHEYRECTSRLGDSIDSLECFFVYSRATGNQQAPALINSPTKRHRHAPASAMSYPPLDYDWRPRQRLIVSDVPCPPPALGETPPSLRLDVQRVRIRKEMTT